MKLLPFENITYKTHLKQEEILKRLDELIEPEQNVWFKFLHSNLRKKPYEGKINGQEFTIKRIISYRNSFLPVISGTVEKDITGTEITVKMRLNIFVLIFMSVWCLFVGVACIGVLAIALSSKNFTLPELIPFGMLFFAYAMTIGGFKFESSKSKKDLQMVFESEII